MSNSSELKDILHDLDHQKLEAIGVEQLGNQTKDALSATLDILRIFSLSPAQNIALLNVLSEVLQEAACSKCLDLSFRIQKNLLREYANFEANRKD